MELLEKEKIAAKFGSFVREAREKCGRQQGEVAETLGISRAYYCYIEAGRRQIPLALAINICRLLEIKIDDLVMCLG